MSQSPIRPTRRSYRSKMARVFIDTVANRFPSNDTATVRHCVRFSLIAEEGDGSMTRLEMLIRPHGWKVDSKIQTYLRATPDDFVSDGAPSVRAVEALIPILRRATEFVAFASAYHRQTLEALFADNDMALSHFTTAPWVCVMRDAVPIMRVKQTRDSRWKMPTLVAAHEYFSARPWQEKWIWDEHASQTVFAVRRIYHAIQLLKKSGILSPKHLPTEEIEEAAE